MNWKPERISTKVVIPLILVISVSLALVYGLLTRHINETVIKLNTAALQIETKRLYHFCEKAVEELISDRQFGNPEVMGTKEEVVLSEIETHLLAEGIDGFIASRGTIVFSTIDVTSQPLFKGASGTLEITSAEGRFYGYYLYFPVWEWYLATVLHETPYWASQKQTRLILATTGLVYTLLGLIVLLILLYGVQRPLYLMANQLKGEGRILYRSGTRELDLLASTINRQLDLIIKEGEAKIERKKIEHELDIARNIQQSFLPASMQKINEVDIAAISIPALQVGGDFYDLISLEGGRLGLVIADVSDKGMPAALLMALSRALIRVIAVHEQSITAVIKKTNQLLQEFAASGYFVTLFYAILDIENKALDYVRAGHNPPLLYRPATNTFLHLTGKGASLGVFDEISIEAKHMDLSPNDLLVLFTDGVTEAINSEGSLFGEDRLKKLLQREYRKSSQLIVQAVEREIQSFAEKEPQFDDITLMIVKV